MARLNNIMPEQCRQLVLYDPRTGLFEWQSRPLKLFKNRHGWAIWNAQNSGKPAFLTDNGCGYLVSSMFKKMYLAHRVAWAIEHGEWPEVEIDHINGNRSDNRLANLRSVTTAINRRNAAKPSNNTSGVCGVSWHKRDRSWRAFGKVDGKQIWLGYFQTCKAATEARLAFNAANGFTVRHGT